MASRLAPCPSCTRHVKVGAGSCPFCGADVPTDVAQRVFALGGKPLARAAIMFAGATAVGACSSSTTPTGGGSSSSAESTTSSSGSGSAEHSQTDTGSAVAAYGVFVGSSTTETMGSAVPAYGVMIEPDGGGAVAAYGAHPSPPDNGEP